MGVASSDTVFQLLEQIRIKWISGGASGKSIQGVSNVTSSGSGSLTGGTA